MNRKGPSRLTSFNEKNISFFFLTHIFTVEISLVYCQTILKDVTNLPTNRLRIVPETIRFRLASEMIVECPLILSQTSPYVLLRSNAGEQIFLSENQQNELNQQLQSVYASKHFVKRFPLANKPQKIRFNQNSENALVCKVLDKNRFDYGNITLRLVSDTDSDHRNRMQPPSLSLSDSDFHESHSDSLQLKFSRIPPTSIRKRVGESTKFSCSVTSSSYIDEQVNMAWFKNYRLIASSESIDTEAIPSYPDHHRYSMRNGKLTIRSLRRQDAGNYTCLAYNQFGRVNATTSLEVIGKLTV